MTHVTSYPKERIKVLLLENIHPSAAQLMSQDGLSVEVLSTALGEQELCKKIEDVHLLGIRSKTRVTPKVLEAGRRLLSVGCFCIGTNQVALDAAATRRAATYAGRPARSPPARRAAARGRPARGRRARRRRPAGARRG